MVIGWPERELDTKNQSAWALVDAAQRKLQMPCLLIPQPAHAVLAGAIAAGLEPSAFGELPADILRAIQMHDTGWAGSDAQQIQRLRGDGGGKAMPHSFVAASPAEAGEAWAASIDAVEAFSKQGALVVSRHFTLLAGTDAVRHQKFLKAEAARQQRLGAGGPSPFDLERWTAALGFCDLLSLFLLCGVSAEVDLALAHPAASNASQAPTVHLRKMQLTLQFSPAILRVDRSLSIQGLRHPVTAQGPRADTLSWQVKA